MECEFIFLTAIAEGRPWASDWAWQKKNNGGRTFSETSLGDSFTSQHLRLLHCLYHICEMLIVTQILFSKDSKL